MDSQCQTHKDALDLRERMIRGLNILYSTRDRAVLIYQFPPSLTKNYGVFIVKNHNPIINDNMRALVNSRTGKLKKPYDKRGAVYLKKEMMLRFENSNNYDDKKGLNTKYRLERHCLPDDIFNDECTDRETCYVDLRPHTEMYYQRIMEQAEQDYNDIVAFD